MGVRLPVVAQPVVNSATVNPAAAKRIFRKKSRLASACDCVSSVVVAEVSVVCSNIAEFSTIVW